MNNQHMQPMNMQNVQLLQRGDKLANSNDGLSSGMHSMNLRSGAPKILTNQEKSEQDGAANGKKFINQIQDDKDKKNVINNILLIISCLFYFFYFMLGWKDNK
jgi:hypothetical protein